MSHEGLDSEEGQGRENTVRPKGGKHICQRIDRQVLNNCFIHPTGTMNITTDESLEFAAEVRM